MASRAAVSMVTQKYPVLHSHGFSGSQPPLLPEDQEDPELVPSHLQQHSATPGASKSPVWLSLVLPSLTFLDLPVAKKPGRMHNDAAGSPMRLFWAVGFLSPATSLLFVLAQARRWAALGLFSPFPLSFSLLGVFPSLCFSFLMGISNWPGLRGKDAVKRCPL